MNDLERLRLLESILLCVTLDEPQDLGRLANDIESLCSSIEGCKPAFLLSYSSLWKALEVIADQTFESNTPIQPAQKHDLVEMVGSLLAATQAELARQNS